jgi:putative ABC transport system substrate-binding protein
MGGKRVKGLAPRIFVPIACGVLLLGSCAPAKPAVYRVGVVYTSGGFAEILTGFKAKMAGLGYREGRNIVYDVQDMGESSVEAGRIAKKFVADKVNLILALSTPASLAAKAAAKGTGIPVVFAYASVEGTDLVDNVRQPGGNVTGVRYPGPEAISKRLELMQEIAPRAKRVWICYDRNSPNNIPALEALRRTASTGGVTLVEVPADSMEEMAADLEDRAGGRDIGIDAIILMPDGFNHSPRGLKIIGDFAKRHRLPLGGSFSYTMEAGAVFGNADDLAEVGGLAAPLADKIFRGVAAGDIPVVTPLEGIWINYAIAQKLGLAVPAGMLKMAQTIIH